MTEHSVYLLTGVASGLPYVGRTNDPTRRLRQHRKSKRGIGVQMHVFLNGVSAEASEAAEAETIHLLGVAGVRLDNKTPGGESSADASAAGKIGAPMAHAAMGLEQMQQRAVSMHATKTASERSALGNKMCATLGRERLSAFGKVAAAPGGPLRQKSPCPDCGRLLAPGPMGQHRKHKHQAA